MERIETERMTGKRVSEAHLEHLLQMHSDPLVMATLGGLLSEETTKNKLDEWQQHWSKYDFGLWAFFSKKNGEFVGRGGLRHCSIEGRPEVELAYALMPLFWRQGYATEMGQVSIKLAREYLKLSNLVCFTLIENTGSVAVMTKLGFRYEKEVIRGNKPHVFYRLFL